MSTDSIPATRAPVAERVRAIAPGETAWIAAGPLAVLGVLLIAALGPPLGDLLSGGNTSTFWPEVLPAVQPEPTERARYLLALTVPLLLCGAMVALARSRPRLAADTIEQLVQSAQIVAAFVVFLCVAIQQRYRLPIDYAPVEFRPRNVYFTLPSLLVALALASLAIAALQRPHLRERATRALAAGRVWTIGATALAVVAIAVTLLPAITTDDAVMEGNPIANFHLAFVFDEAMAVLDGRSPLGDFVTQYGALWPYVTAAGMQLLDTSLVVFTTLMAAITGAALLALFAVLRRVTRSAIAALVLFLPLLATCAFVMRGPLDARYSLFNLAGAFPLRFAGPFLLVWLTARHLDGAWPRRPLWLFLIGGLVVLNNVDFGIAALGATVAALLVAAGRPSAARLRALAIDAALGLLAAGALVTLLLLIRTGSPPHVLLLFSYARLFVVDGFGMLPMRPVVGFSTVIYLTYVAALATAVTRAMRGAPDRLLTGLLAWSAIFGLGVGAYYMGRSHPEVLINMLPPWALAVTLLTVVVVRGLAREPRAGRLPAFACLVAFGLLVCSLAQTPRPWDELRRLEATASRDFAQPPGQAFVAQQTRAGEHVVILMELGHRISANVGVDDVTPYTGVYSIPTVERLDDTLAELRAAGGRKVFLSPTRTYPAALRALERRDYVRSATNEDGIELWLAPSDGD